MTIRHCVSCCVTEARLPKEDPHYCCLDCALCRAVELEDLAWCQKHSLWFYTGLGCQHCRGAKNRGPQPAPPKVKAKRGRGQTTPPTKGRKADGRFAKEDGTEDG